MYWYVLVCIGMYNIVLFEFGVKFEAVQLLKIKILTIGFLFPTKHELVVGITDNYINHIIIFNNMLKFCFLFF